jgi:hypothetical protein
LLLNPEIERDFLNYDLLSDSFTLNSLNIFYRFNIPSDYLQVDPHDWSYNNNYKKAQNILISLKVLNDTEERNFKLMEEFNKKVTKYEDQKQ